MDAAIDQRVADIEAHTGHSTMEGAPDGWQATEYRAGNVLIRKVWAGLLTKVGEDVYWSPDAMAPAYWFPQNPG